VQIDHVFAEPLAQVGLQQAAPLGVLGKHEGVVSGGYHLVKHLREAGQLA